MVVSPTCPPHTKVCWPHACRESTWLGTLFSTLVSSNLGGPRLELVARSVRRSGASPAPPDTSTAPSWRKTMSLTVPPCSAFSSGSWTVARVAASSCSLGPVTVGARPVT